MDVPRDEYCNPREDFMISYVAGGGLCLYHAIYSALLSIGTVVEYHRLYSYLIEAGDYYTAFLSRAFNFDILEKDKETGKWIHEDWRIGEQVDWFDTNSLGVICNYLGVNIVVHNQTDKQSICYVNERYDPRYPTCHVLITGAGLYGRHYHSMTPLSSRRFYLDIDTNSARVMVDSNQPDDRVVRLRCTITPYHQPDPAEYPSLLEGHTSYFAEKNVLIRNWQMASASLDIPKPKASSMSRELPSFDRAFRTTIREAENVDSWTDIDIVGKLSEREGLIYRKTESHSGFMPAELNCEGESTGFDVPIRVSSNHDSVDDGYTMEDESENQPTGSDPKAENPTSDDKDKSKVRWVDMLSDSEGSALNQDDQDRESEVKPHGEALMLEAEPIESDSDDELQVSESFTPGEIIDPEYTQTFEDPLSNAVIITKRTRASTQIYLSIDDILESNSTLASSIYMSKMKTPIMTIHDDDLHKLPHEIVALCFSNTETDVQLKIDLDESKVNSKFAKMTPDIRIKPKVYLEIATNYIGTDKRLMEVLRGKLATYEMAFEELGVIDEFRLYVVAVSRKAITSNFRIPENEANFLSSAYKLGLRILSKIKEDYGIAAKSDETRSTKRMKESMNKCVLPKDAVLPLISENQLDTWERMYKGGVADVDLVTKNLIRDGIAAFRNDRTRQDGPTSCKKYVSEVEKLGPRSDSKAIIQFNCVPMVKPDTYSTAIPYLHIEDDVNPMLTFVSKALDARVTMLGSETNEPNETYSDLEKKMTNDLRWKTMKRQDRNVVRLELTDRERMYIAEQGVQAKRFKFDPLIFNKKGRSQRPFSLKDTDVSDIEQFVNNTQVHIAVPDCYMPEPEIYMQNLINKASMISNGRSESFAQSCINNFRKTALGQFLFMTQLIVEEVNLDLKVNVRSDEFVVKKMIDQDTYLVIKPTRSDSHIFFCIITIQEPLCELPFKTTWYKSGDWHVSTFVSLDRLRIANLLGCFEKVCLIRHMLMETWGCSMNSMVGDEPIDAIDRDMRDDCYKVVNFLVLTMFSDNTSVTDMLQNVRYAYMEVCSGKIGLVDPLKIVSKFPIPRNRLCVFIYRRFVSAFTKMTVKRPTYLADMTDKEFNPEETAPSRDVFSGLLNWLTGAEIMRFEQAIELSYLGIMHNKDEGDIAQGQFQILNKIISQEIKMRDARPECMGNISNQKLDEIRTHEFDANFVLSSGHLLAVDASTKFSNSKPSYVEDKLSSMRMKRLEEFATFKSSARKIHDSTWAVGMSHDPRTKTIKAVMELLESSDDSISPYVFDHISDLIDGSKDQPMVVDMFKKNQLTGIREIFILWIVDRITIFFMEEFFYNIADDVDSEMISKGKAKYARGLSFRSIVARASVGKDTKIEQNDSSDAATWCQQFVMSIVPCFLTPILHDTCKPLLRCISAVCNNITNKKLLIPSDMLHKFFMKKEVLSSDDGLNELKSQFLGKSEHNDLLMKGHTSFSNRSNFMQGICGITFSVIHAYALKLEDIAERRLAKQLYGDMEDKVRFITLDQVSSDDKGKQRALIFNGDLPVSGEVFLSICSKMTEVMMPRFCAKNSYEKSTNGSFSGIYEFNSFWSVRGTYTVPKIKFCATTTDPKISMDIEGRRSKWSNLAKQLLESGCSMLTTDVCQRLQARISYYCMGMNSNKHFVHYSMVLGQNPHPAFGFFTLEPENCCGILGSNFAKYILMRKSDRANKIEQSIASKSECIISKGGEITVRINATPINMSKYFRFKSTLGDAQSAERVFHEDPALLFRQAESRDEMIAKIMLKTRDPEAAQSFSFDCSQKVYVMGLFMISHQCMALRSGLVTRSGKRNRDDKNRGLKLMDKILGYRDDDKVIPSIGINESGDEIALKCTMAALMKILGEGDQLLSEESIRLMYPLNSIYDYCLNDLDKIEYGDYARTMRENSRYITTTYLERDVAVKRVSMMEACSYTWFGNQSKYSSTILRSAFERYKKEVAFIKDSFDDTLDSSPFDSPVDLYSFLLSLQENRLSVSILAPVKKLPIKIYLEKLVQRSWCRFHVRSSESRRVTYPDELEIAGRILSSPMENSDKERLIRNMYIKMKMLSDKTNDAINDLNTLPLSVQTFIMAMDTLVHQSSSRFLALISSSNKGHIGLYTKPQKYNKDLETWSGSGTYCYQIGRYTSYIRLFDNDAMDISTNAPDSADRMYKGLSKFIRKNGWCGNSTTGRRLTIDGITSKSGKPGITIRTCQTVQPINPADLKLEVCCTRSGLLKVRSSATYEDGYKPTLLNATAPSVASGKSHLGEKYKFLFENLSPEVKSWLSCRPHDPSILSKSVDKLMKMKELDPNFGTTEYKGESDRLSRMLTWCEWSVKHRMSTITTMPLTQIRGGKDDTWDVTPVDRDYEHYDEYRDPEDEDESETLEYDDDASTPSYLKGIDGGAFDFEFDETLDVEEAAASLGATLQDVALNAGIEDFDLSGLDFQGMTGMMSYHVETNVNDDELQYLVRNSAAALNRFWDDFMMLAKKEDMSQGCIILSRYKPSDDTIKSLPPALRFILHNMNLDHREEIPQAPVVDDVEIPEDSMFA